MNPGVKKYGLVYHHVIEVVLKYTTRTGDLFRIDKAPHPPFAAPFETRSSSSPKLGVLKRDLDLATLKTVHALMSRLKGLYLGTRG